MINVIVLANDIRERMTVNCLNQTIITSYFFVGLILHFFALNWPKYLQFINHFFLNIFNLFSNIPNLVHNRYHFLLDVHFGFLISVF